MFKFKHNFTSVKLDNLKIIFCFEFFDILNLKMAKKNILTKYQNISEIV